MPKIGTNVSYEVKGSQLVITLDTKSKGETSKSGKSVVVASTKGNQAIAIGNDVLRLGLNLYK